LACLIVMSFAALASLGISLSAGSLRSATPSPAEIVALRFPSADAALPTLPATFATAGLMPVEHWETFNQDTLYPVMSADQPEPTEAETTEPSISEPAQQPPAAVETVKPEPANVPTPVANPRRVTARSGNVLNDAQIASIKRRLKLTAEQERMWPAVEAALRKIMYTKSALEAHPHAAQLSGAHAYIDPNSAEVLQLKNAALPLIVRLNDEQKREVKMLAYVMGLEAVASQF